MKRTMKITITIVFVLLCGNALRSETVRWIVQPQYDHISYFSPDIFKCVKDNHIELIDWLGNFLTDQDLLIDSVTDFVGGYALALKTEKVGYKILGFVSEQKDHLFQRVDGDYYLTQYPFFSEGYLVVSNPKGKMGYLDGNGVCVIDCKYDKARPFRKGLASVQFDVGKNESRGYYINPLGKTKNPLGFHDGKIDKGSSFNDEGEAVVKNGRDCAIINRDMEVVRNRTYDGVFPIRTYDYAYSEDYANPPSIVRYKPVPDKRYLVFKNSSGYGYQSAENEIVVPAQFSDAEMMCNGRAVASIDGKYGVLELVDGSFASVCSPSEEKLIVYPKMNCNNLRYEVLIPDCFNQDNVRVRFDKGDGKMDEADLAMEFKPSIEKGDSVYTMRAQLWSDDGLLLWEDEKSLDIDYVRIGISSPETVSVYAGEDDVQRIKAIVTNNSEVDVTVWPSFNLSFGSKSKNKIQSKTVEEPIKLKPGEKRELIVSVNVSENETIKAMVTVSVDGFECGSVSSQVLLKKI